MKVVISTHLDGGSAQFDVLSEADSDGLLAAIVEHKRKVAKTCFALRANEGPPKLETVVQCEGYTITVCTWQNPGESDQDWERRHEAAVQDAINSCN